MRVGPQREPAKTEKSREELAAEQLGKHGWSVGSVALVRSAGDSLAGCEEVWFTTQTGTRKVAYFSPVMSGGRAVRHAVTVEDGW
jgi:hypothetical protein